MTHTHSFKAKDLDATVTVKSEFLTVCPNPENYEMHELAIDHQILTYLHNEVGPAVRIPSENVEEYWVDGRCISTEDPALVERMKAKLAFNDKFDEFVGEGTGA